jgi:hypothetical protein
MVTAGAFDVAKVLDYAAAALAVVMDLLWSLQVSGF